MTLFLPLDFYMRDNRITAEWAQNLWIIEGFMYSFIDQRSLFPIYSSYLIYEYPSRSPDLYSKYICCDQHKYVTWPCASGEGKVCFVFVRRFWIKLQWLVIGLRMVRGYDQCHHTGLHHVGRVNSCSLSATHVGLFFWLSTTKSYTTRIRISLSCLENVVCDPHNKILRNTA